MTRKVTYLDMRECAALLNLKETAKSTWQECSERGLNFQTDLRCSNRRMSSHTDVTRCGRKRVTRDVYDSPTDKASFKNIYIWECHCRMLRKQSCHTFHLC